LTLREYEMLEYLVRHKGEVVSRAMLARDVWHETVRATSLDNVIDVHIARLRRKVDHDSRDRLIHTVRGVGFLAGSRRRSTRRSNGSNGRSISCAVSPRTRRTSCARP
jgi:DNA-binding response OmpR family regulator